MRIGLTTQTFSPEFIGGREKHVEEIAKRLGKKHEVVVFSGTKKRIIVKEKMDNFLSIKVPIMPLSLTKEQHYIFLPKMLSAMMKFNFDMVHAHEYGHFSTDVAAKYCRRKNIPLIITIHGYELDKPHVEFGRRIYDKLWGKNNLKLARKIICVSTAQLEELKKISNSEAILKKAVVLPNSFDLKSVNVKKNQEKNFVLAMGRLVKRKGFHVLIEASEKIDARIKMFGPDYGFKRHLENEIKKRKLENKVELNLPVEGEDKEKVFNEATIFVLPSKYEGFPTVLLEAMAYGKPIVASRLPSTLQIIKEGKNGFLVEPNSPGELATKVNILLKNQKLRHRMSEQNIKDVKKYEWDDSIKEIERIYEEALE